MQKLDLRKVETNMSMKMLSLFDGSGGFSLSGYLRGLDPIMAREVEP